MKIDTGQNCAADTIQHYNNSIVDTWPQDKKIQLIPSHATNNNDTIFDTWPQDKMILLIPGHPTL